LIDQEIHRRLRELELRLQEQGVKMDKYLEYTKTSADALHEEQRPAAVQKVRLELALETVAAQAGLTVPDAEIDAALNAALSEDQQASRRARDLRTADPVRAYFRHQLLMRQDHRPSRKPGRARFFRYNWGTLRGGRPGGRGRTGVEGAAARGGQEGRMINRRIQK